jgi:hypothetical protein
MSEGSMKDALARYATVTESVEEGETYVSIDVH